MRTIHPIFLALLAVSVFAFCIPAISADNAETDVQSMDQTDTATTSPSSETQVSSEAPASPATPTSPTSVTAAKKNKNVLRALLTTAIVDKEPVDEVVSIDKNQDRIYFFTEFANMRGQAIKHRWEYQGKTMAEVNFNVGSSKWRCYSSKNILPEWTGIWTVSVIDNTGKVIHESLFEVKE